ncbi:hypothetical protein TTHERM_00705160 (macronuclear) [Tetrahymena thermophila SB210]|uniref:Uncharacterized protein n=1 Tax=Tetrahymena thermophila (strain SB210) TaxID=312017 RepID=I7M0P8_TETTS|nr:hypothetical protein TTHERM_00705160 [Tetrahymena thermophila SB210]EAR90700.2 hypothetical protein TTHERM_00705160 [Tetrahymena thermophila SB210]|eukprot:XP_001010945.2 hypothetical protein TTHERM_00705160 [Tetrahymena thermophila SB210]
MTQFPQSYLLFYQISLGSYQLFTFTKQIPKITKFYFFTILSQKQKRKSNLKYKTILILTLQTSIILLTVKKLVYSKDTRNQIKFNYQSYQKSNRNLKKVYHFFLNIQRTQQVLNQAIGLEALQQHFLTQAQIPTLCQVQQYANNIYRQLLNSQVFTFPSYQIQLQQCLLQERQQIDIKYGLMFITLYLFQLFQEQSFQYIKSQLQHFAQQAQLTVQGLLQNFH